MDIKDLEAQAQQQADATEAQTMGLSTGDNSSPVEQFGNTEQLPQEGGNTIFNPSDFVEQRDTSNLTRFQGAELYNPDNYPQLKALDEQLQARKEQPVVNKMEQEKIAQDTFKQNYIAMKMSELLDARGVPVEKTLRAREIGKTLGLPENVVLSDLPTYERQYAQKQDYITLKDDDSTLAFLSNPLNLRLVNDDLKELNVFSKTVKGLSEGAGQAMTERDQGFQLFLDMYNQKEPTEFDLDKEINTKSWAYSGAKAVSHFTTAMGASVAVGGSAGAVAGGAVGSVVPVGGTLAGAGAGAIGGISADQAAQTAGFIYQETYRKLIKAGTSKNEAIKLASEAGTNAFVLNFGLGIVPVGGVANRFVGTFAKGVQSTLAGTVARGAVEGGLAMGGAEIGNVLAIENAQRKAGVDNVFSNPTAEKFSEIGSRVGTATATGAFSIGALSGVMHPVGKGIARFLEKGREPLTGEQTVIQALDDATQTKTLARDAELFQSYADTTVDGKPLFMSRDLVMQEAIANPEQWAKLIPDLHEQLAKTKETGEDIVIKGGRYLTYLAGSEDGKRLAGDLRFTADGATANEVRANFGELDEATKAQVTTLFDQINGQFNTPEVLNRQRVKQTIIDEIKKIPQIAKADRNAVAEFYTSRYEARAKQNEGRFGGVLEEYKRNPFTFQNADEFIADNQASTAISKQRAENQKKETVRQFLANEADARQSVVLDTQPVKPSFTGKRLSDNQVKVGDEYVPSQVMIVDADTLTPTLEKGENQARDRSRVASEIQIEKYANNLDPNYLTASHPDMTSGSPTLSPDGKIIGGNGRAEAIRRAYERGGADAYRAMVEAEAKKAGVSIGKMKRPVLVRVFRNNVDIRRASILSNEATSAVQSALEQAGVDASRIGDVGAFQFNENGVMSKTGNETALTQFLSQLPTEEQGRFIDAEGHISIEGERRIQNAILYRAYGDSPLLSRLIEDTTPEGRNVNTAMARLAPELARIEDAMARGELHNVSLREDLLSAVDKFLELKRKNQTVDDYLRQGNLLGADLTPEGVSFLQAIEKNSKSAKRLGDALGDVYRKIEQYGDPRMEDLFGDRPIPTKSDVLSVLDNLEQGQFPDALYQGNRGRILLNDVLKVIQVFKDGDPSTMIHEGGHLFLDEFIQDATTAPKDLSSQLKTDYDTTKQWWKDISKDLLDMHEKKNIFKSKLVDRKKELVLLKEMRDKGGIDYLKQFIDGDLKVTDELSGFAYRLLHEVWARGFERYLMEGKAPSNKLAQVFERFAKWLTDFYKKVENLNAPINDSIREVMGRLISADDAVTQVKRDANLDPMFPSQEASGMSKADYEKYVENIKSQNATLLQKTLERQMKALKAKATEEGKQRLKDISNRLDRESKKERHIQTYNRMMGFDDSGKPVGEGMKIKPSDFVDKYGKDALKLVPKELLSDEGLSLRNVADTFGYKDVADLKNDLALVQKMRLEEGGNRLTIEQARQRSIERQAQQELKDLTDPESLYDEALDGLHTSLFEKGLTDEMNALSKLASETLGIKDLSKVDPNSLGDYVKNELMANTPLEKILSHSKSYLNAERRAGNKAQQHLLNGKYIEALSAKREQTVAYLMYKEALAIKKTVDKSKRLFKRIADNKTIKNVSDDAMAIMHRILQDQGITTVRSGKPSREGYFTPEIEHYFTDKDGNTLPLHEAIQSFIDADKDTRDTIFIADSIKQSDPTQRKAVTVGQFLELHDTIQSIYEHGKAEQELYLGGKRENFKQFIDDIVSVGWEGRKEPKPKNRATRRSLSRFKSLAEAIYGKFSQVMASVVRASTVFNNLDRYNPNGKFNQLFSRLHEGMGKYLAYTEGFQKGLHDFKKKVGGGRFREFVNELNNKKVENNLLGDHTEQGMLTMYKGDIIGIALHRGSPDNFRKLVEGRATREDGSLTGWTPENVDAMLKQHMTKEDWDFVQMMWREVGKTWPDLVAVQKRVNGFAPDKVVTTTIQTPFGEIEGGYFPLTYEDTFRSVDNSQAVGKDVSFGDALNASGAKNRTVGFKKPVSIDFFRGVDQAQKTAYATHLVEPFRDMQKVLNHPKVKKLIEGTWSEHHYKAIKDMMEEVKSPNRQNVGMADYVQSWGNWLHGGGVITNFVYAVKPFMDSISELVAVPFSRSISKLGYAKAVAKATLGEAWNRIARNGESEYTWARQFDAVKALDESQSQRWDAFSDEITERWGNTRRGLRAVRNFGFQVLETTSRFTSTAVARSAYEMYIKKHPDASYREISDFVNKTVRESHISRNVLDTPLVQRNKRNAHLKWFMTFSLKAINSMMDLLYESRDAIFSPTKEQTILNRSGIVAKNTVYGLIGLAIPQMSYMYLSDKIPKDDEGKPDYFKAMAIAPFYSAISGFSVIRDIADIILSDDPFAGSNLDSRYRDFSQAVKDAKRLAEGKNEYGKRESHTLLRLMGTLTHTPTKPITGAEYIYRYNEGDIRYNEDVNFENFPARVKDFQTGYQK
ncbi:crystallin beta/gamma motif-containing protein [Caudoviricetes sp.]|nr:crystallin beta/gamma motif-containing protein [Caudoviricetes sp.]